MTTKTFYNSVKKGGKSAYTSFSKNPKGHVKTISWILIAILIYTFWSKIYEMITGLFSDKPSEEEQHKKDLIDQIYVDESEVTLSESQIADRISQFKSGLTGYGSDPKKVFKSLTNHAPVGFKYQDWTTAKQMAEKIKSGLPWEQIEAFNWISDNKCGLLEEYKSYPSSLRLGFHNIRKIYKTFGIQPWGIVSTTYGSMIDWINDEEEGSEYAFFWYIMSKCNLN